MEETNGPLISVIVPIYNVEGYLRKCLDSLRGQTLKEIEVICIDDGSTDESGKIADKYVSEDWPRFRVFHTENRGLSAARNRGIDEAVAGWLMFVDSDDWVSPDFCRIPFEAALENQTDMVIFQWYYVKNGQIKKLQRSGIKYGIIDKFSAHEYGSTVAWNKLYKRNLFENIEYPESRAFEEIATTHKVVSAANRIIMLSDFLYYYLEREGSISHIHTPSNRRDLFIGTLERYEFLMKTGYPHEALVDLLRKNAIGYIVSVLPSDDELYIKARDIVNGIHGIPKVLTHKQKIALIMWKINRNLFYYFCKFSGRISRDI